MALAVYTLHHLRPHPAMALAAHEGRAKARPVRAPPTAPGPIRRRATAVTAMAPITRAFFFMSRLQSVLRDGVVRCPAIGEE